MKARVKATGEIVDVSVEMDFRNLNRPPRIYYQRKDKPSIKYKESNLEFTVTYDALCSGQLKEFFVQNIDSDY